MGVLSHRGYQRTAIPARGASKGDPRLRCGLVWVVCKYCMGVLSQRGYQQAAIPARGASKGDTRLRCGLVWGMCYTAALRMQQFLYFLPLPQGQGSLRPTFSVRLRIGSGFLSLFWLLAIAAACCPWVLSAPRTARGAASCVAAPIIHTDS